MIYATVKLLNENVHINRDILKRKTTAKAVRDKWKEERKDDGKRI